MTLNAGNLPRSNREPTSEDVGHPAVEVHGLAHRYGALAALDGVELDVPRGAIVAVLGPNGSGKTTLFRILATLLSPSEKGGTLSILGLDPRTQPHEVRRRIGVTFQSPSLDKKLTVAENLRYHGHLYGLRGPELTRRIADLLEKMDLTGRMKDRVEKLSGGLMRRVEIAKSLLQQPQVLLLDEPSVGLDPGARRILRQQIEALRGDWGVTCLLTTHLMDEADTCDWVAIMDHGRIVALGRPDALRSQIAGDVITLRVGEGAAIQASIRERFGLSSQQIGDCLRVERENGYELAGQLAAAFAGHISAVTVSRPTLDDVFFKYTGRRLEENAHAALGRPK